MIDFKIALEQGKEVIIRPSSFWLKFTNNCPEEKEIRNTFVVPIFIIAFFADFIGALFFSSRGLQGGYALIRASASLTMLSADVYLCSWVISKIFESYGYGKSFNKAFTILAFSSIPSWFASITLSLFPKFLIIWFFSFYSFYLLWQGIKSIYAPQPEHRSGLLLGTMGTVIIIGTLIQMCVLKLLDIIYSNNIEGIL